MTNLSNTLKKIRYNKVLGPFFCIIVPGAALHAYIEYVDTGLSLYLLRDLINVSVILVAALLFKYAIIEKRGLISISLYSITLCLGYTFIIGQFDADFVFIQEFLRAQMVFAVVLFAAGTMIDLKHLMVLNVLNIIFIIICSVTIGKDFLIWRFVFCALLVSGGGFVAYAGQKFARSLYSKVKEAGILIETQNEELKKVNKAKDQLFRIIGHDLKTPFHQLNVLVDLLVESTDDEQTLEYKKLIKESALSGTELLEGLLNWSQNVGQMDMVLEDILIADLVNKISEFYSFKSQGKQIELVNELPNDLKLNASETMMETIFRNLIGNAIKFSYPNSEVRITYEIKQDQVIICVVDKGIGIDSDRNEILLSGTRNVSTQGTSEEEGTGFGLGIVTKLVERQMGFIAIDSELGKGTTVKLSFPKNTSLA